MGIDEGRVGQVQEKHQAIASAIVISYISIILQKSLIRSTRVNSNSRRLKRKVIVIGV